MDHQVIVRFDEDRITAVHQEGVSESVLWSGLSAVIIKTTDEGPFFEDVFFILIGDYNRSGIVVPHGAVGASDLLNALQERLPGFDNEKVIEAMSSTENNSFLVWDKMKLW